MLGMRRLLIAFGLSQLLVCASAQQRDSVTLRCLSPVCPTTTSTGSSEKIVLSLLSASELYPVPTLELRPQFLNSLGDFTNLFGFYILDWPNRDVTDDFSLNMPP